MSRMICEEFNIGKQRFTAIPRTDHGAFVSLPLLVPRIA